MTQDTIFIIIATDFYVMHTSFVNNLYNGYSIE